jgi:hypothetical protein
MGNKTFYASKLFLICLHPGWGGILVSLLKPWIYIILIDMTAELRE